MCNAWNHPQECRCGWGGDGHTGKRLDGAHYTQWVPPLDFSFESYTRPNASCPACGQPVFFYSSPDGGRVFFDELGPPWPKHPCTDNTSAPARFRGKSNNSLKCGVESQWLKDGWMPIQLRHDIEVDKYFARLHVIFRNEEADFYLRKSALTKYGRRVSINGNLPAHLKEIADGAFELSMLDTFARPFRVLCYASLASARDHEPVPTPKKGRNKTAKPFKVAPEETDKQKRLRKKNFRRGLRVGKL
jgi:hypothetical protein